MDENRHSTEPLYTFHAVPDDLARYVRRISYANSENVDQTIRVGSTGYMFLTHLFRSTEIYVKILKGDAIYMVNPPINAILGVPVDNDFTVIYQGNHNQVLLEFTATGFYELFHQPALPLVNKVVDLATIHPKIAIAIDRLPVYGNHVDKMIEDLVTILWPLTQRARQPPIFVKKLVDHIEKANGQIDFMDVYRDMGYSPHHIAKTFTETVGMKPKQFATTRQLNYMFELLSSGRYKTFTELAMESGFYDQPHFVRAVRQYIDAAPSAILKHPDFEVMKEFLGLINTQNSNLANQESSITH